VSAHLDGRVYAIAGAAGGLGPTVARRLAEAGAALALTDRVAEALDDVVAGLGLPEERIDARVVDLLEEHDTNAWADAVAERFGRVGGVVHPVGGYKGGDPIPTPSLGDYTWLHDLLVRTLQLTSRAFHDHIAHPGGRFVLVSSTQAQRPQATNASYAATKAAAETWTLALADSLAPSGATANIVVVNAILTPAMRERNPGKEYPAFTPAEDIADAIAYLLSDAAAKMNGARLELHP